MTQEGWICPRCGKVNAPWVIQCSCNMNTQILPKVGAPYYQPAINHSNLGKNGKVYMANNSPLLANYGYDYISISVRKGTKLHNILEKLMPLKGVKRSYGAEVCYRVPKSEFKKEELV